jgi:hypothetical protein
METIKCDVCGKLLNENHIRLGSETKQHLAFENNVTNEIGETRYLGRYRDLHFCSMKHFVGYFFGTTQVVVFTPSELEELKQKVAEEAWDASFNHNVFNSALPNKTEYLKSLSDEQVTNVSESKAEPNCDHSYFMASFRGGQWFQCRKCGHHKK